MKSDAAQLATIAAPVEDTFTPDQVAAMLGGVHRSFVLRRCRPGMLWPIYRPSRKVLLIPASSLARYLAAVRLGDPLTPAQLRAASQPGQRAAQFRAATSQPGQRAARPAP